MKIKVFGKCILPHASQIYTGLYRLKVLDLISLEYASEKWIPERFHYKLEKHSLTPGIFAQIDTKKVYFDLIDSPNINQAVYPYVDFYFKRSYLTGGYGCTNIIPLGLNFEIYNTRPYWFEASRFLTINYNKSMRFKSKISVLLDSIGIGYLPRIKDFETSGIDIEGPHEVLFIVRTWDPNESGAKLSQAEKEDRFKLNQERASIIKSLQRELGSRFLGGFAKTEHSQREFPDCVVQNNLITKKKNYISIVKRTPICIATTGLHGSIGWKFAEYVALNRAIISEETNLLIPHNFSENKNYLSFVSSINCLEQTNKLITNRELVLSIMENNKIYYEKYLNPEKMVLNALLHLH